MIGQIITFEKVNGVLKPVNGELSPYQPTEDVVEITRHVKRDYQTGIDILYDPRREFNNKSVLDELNDNQQAFLMYPRQDLIDPEENWRWNGVRPVTRNRILSLAAHLTANTLIPGVFAQNPDDEEDREMAEIMRAMIEWNVRNSDYDVTFLYAVIAGLVNPVAYLGVEFIEAVQMIKTRTRNGIKREEAIDDVLSGLQVSSIPLDEILITNPYEYEIQRQRALGRRQYIEYSQLEKIFGNHPNWKFVTPGVKTIYNEEDGTFYDQRDEDLDTLAERFEYFNRGDDLQIPFINGIYLGETDVLANPMKHRDQENRPKYPLIKFGAEPIDEKRFFFYKSIASKLMQNYKLTNRIWQIVVDTEVLNLKPPVGVMGDDKLGTDIYYPGAAVNVGKDTSFMQFPTGNAASGYNLLSFIDQDTNESTQDPIRGGVAAAGQQTAFEISRIEQNARTQLGLIGKMMIQMVRDLGDRMIENIIQHETVANIEEVVSGTLRLKFRRFLLPGQGGEKTREINFDDSLIGTEMTEAAVSKRKQILFEQEGGTEGNKRISLVNPNIFKKIKFMAIVDAEVLMPKNEALETALKLDAYAKAITNPLIASDVEAMENVTKDLLLGALKPTKGREHKYLPKRKPQNVLQAVQQEGEPPISTQMMESERAANLTQLQT